MIHYVSRVHKELTVDCKMTSQQKFKLIHLL